MGIADAGIGVYESVRLALLKLSGCWLFRYPKSCDNRFYKLAQVADGSSDTVDRSSTMKPIMASAYWVRASVRALLSPPSPAFLGNTCGVATLKAPVVLGIERQLVQLFSLFKRIRHQVP
jgi:hypothetical protein